MKIGPYAPTVANGNPFIRPLTFLYSYSMNFMSDRSSFHDSFDCAKLRVAQLGQRTTIFS